MTSETPENPIQITHCIKTRLCLENYKENYPIWEREVFEVLRGHGLLDFFYGTNFPSIPADGTMSVEFECWQTKDKVIWEWLFSTLAPDIQSNLGQLAHATTHLLWICLRSMDSTNPLPSEFYLENPPFISRTTKNPTNPQISSTSENLIQINHQISIPLNEENYQQNFPHWESEVLRLLGGLGLQDYLDRTIGHGVRWKQDKLIWNWLWSSLPPTIVCELRYQPCATAPMWKRLRFMHTTNYFQTVRKLKLQLQTIKKGNATCAEYLQQFNLIIGQLIHVGCFLDDQQQVPYVLQGLGQEFEHFVTAATMTSQTLTMTNLYRLLFEEEKCLKHLFSLAQPPIVHNPGTASSNDIYFIGQNSSLFAGPAQNTPLSQPRIVHNPGQNPSLFAGRAQNTPLSQPPIVHNPGQNSSLFACRAQYAPLSQPPIVHNPGQNSIVHQPGQNSSLFAGRAQNVPLSQPPIDPLFDSSYQEVPSSSQQVSPMPYFTPSELECLNYLLSSSPDTGTDQPHVENGAGLFIYYLGSSIIYSPRKPLYFNNILHAFHIKY